MNKRVLFGALAALGAAGVAADAKIGAPNYPTLHKLFDGDWEVAHNLSLLAFSLMAAVFGYLSLNIKDNNGGSHGSATTPVGHDQSKS
jgi:hypothetical protein